MLKEAQELQDLVQDKLMELIYLRKTIPAKIQVIKTKDEPVEEQERREIAPVDQSVLDIYERICLLKNKLQKVEFRLM